MAVARLVGVLVEHVALDSSHPKTAKDSRQLRAYSLVLVDAVKAFASLEVIQRGYTGYFADRIVYSYDTKQFIGASALLGALVCARSGRGSEFDRMFTTVADASVVKDTRCVYRAGLWAPLV